MWAVFAFLLWIMDIWTVNNKCQVSIQLLVEIKHCKTGLKPTCRTHKLNLLNCPCKSSLLILSMLTVDLPPGSTWTWGWSTQIVDPLYVNCWFAIQDPCGSRAGLLSLGADPPRLLILSMLTVNLPPQGSTRIQGWSTWIVDPLYVNCQFASPKFPHGSGADPCRLLILSMSTVNWPPQDLHGSSRVAAFLPTWNSLCFPCVFPVLQKFSLCFFIEELTVIVIKEMSLAPSYTIYFLLKPYTA